MIFPSCFLLILYGLVHKSFGFWFNAPGVLNNKIVHYPRHCIDTTVSPVNDQNEHVAKISKLENSTPTMKDKFTVRPELITFDAYDTLIAPCQSIGRWYREALNTACDMSIRLPRPQLFQISFETVYNEM